MKQKHFRPRKTEQVSTLSLHWKKLAGKKKWIARNNREEKNYIIHVSWNKYLL